MDPFDEHSLLTNDDDSASSSDMAGPNPSFVKHKKRGPTMMQHLRKDVGGRKKLKPQYNEVGVAINCAAVQMNNLEGSFVRRTIPISLPNWKAVPQALKNNLWESIKQYSNKDESFKKGTLSDCAVKWRRFKSVLFVTYVRPYLDTPEMFKHPPQQYDFITQDVWDEFVKQRLTDEFKEVSDKQSKRRKLNKYPHRLGAIGYARLEKIMQNERGTQDYIGRDDLWTRARIGKDGTYANKDVECLVEKIDVLRNKAKEGEIESLPPNDILTQALGTEEYGGRLRGRGKHYTVSNFFHIPRQSSQKKDKFDESERITKLELVVSGLLDIIQQKGNFEKISELVSTCGITLQSQPHTHGEQSSHGDALLSHSHTGLSHGDHGVHDEHVANRRTPSTSKFDAPLVHPSPTTS